MKRILFLFLFLILPQIVFAQDVIIKTTQDAFELYSVGNYEEAAPIFEEAALMMKENAKDDVKGIIKISLYTGLSYKEIEEYDKAIKWFKEALNLASEVGDKEYSIKILSNIADTQRLDGAYNNAVKNYLTVLKYDYLSEKEKAAIYYGLADCYRLMGEYEKAYESCEKSIPLSQKFAMDKLYLSCLIIEGETYRINGNYGKSLQKFGIALDTGRARNYYDISVSALNGIGLVSEKLNRIDAARNSFEEALILSLKNEDFDNIYLIIDKIISFLPSSGVFVDRGDELLEIINSLSHIKDSELKLAIYKLISLYYKLSNAYEKLYIVSNNIYNEALELNNNYDAYVGLYYSAYSLYGLKKYNQAIDKTDEALSRKKNLSDKKYIHEIYYIRAECYFEEKDVKNAEKFYEEAIKLATDSKVKEKYKARLKEIVDYKSDDNEKTLQILNDEIL